MGIPVDGAIWLTLISLAAYCSKQVSKKSSYKHASRRNGCSTLPRYPHKEPTLGLDLLYDQFRSIIRGDTISPDLQGYKQHGQTSQAKSWGTKIIFTMDSRNVQTIFASAFDNFGVASLRYGPSVPLLGSGIFTADGPQWEHSKNLAKPIFARAQLSDLTYLEKHVKRMIERIPRDGSTIDLQSLLKLLVITWSQGFYAVLTWGYLS